MACYIDNIPSDVLDWYLNDSKDTQPCITEFFKYKDRPRGQELIQPCITHFFKKEDNLNVDQLNSELSSTTTGQVGVFNQEITTCSNLSLKVHFLLHATEAIFY